MKEESEGQATPKKIWVCESGGHSEVITPGSLLELAWDSDQKDGSMNPLIIPTISCPYCVSFKDLTR